MNIVIYVNFGLSGPAGPGNHATRQPKPTFWAPTTPCVLRMGLACCVPYALCPTTDIRVFKSCAGNYRRTYTVSSFVMHAEF